MNEAQPQRPLHVKGYGGLGDQVYQRPLVRHLVATRGPLWLSTPYPELWEDMPDVHPVRFRALELRCQSKAMDRTPAEVWRQVPDARAERIPISYAHRLPRRGIVEEMEESARTRIHNFKFDLPDFGASPVAGRYAVIRPASVRTEWRNYARNPDPAYLAEAARLLRASGLRVVVVADIEPPAEELIGEMPEGDLYYVRGELNTRSLFALVNHAALVVGGVGWILPTAMAYRTPAIILGGGLGRHNHPSLLADPRMGERPIRYLLPEPFCLCANTQHACRKVIPDFQDRFLGTVAELLDATTEVAA